MTSLAEAEAQNRAVPYKGHLVKSPSWDSNQVCLTSEPTLFILSCRAVITSKFGGGALLAGS